MGRTSVVHGTTDRHASIVDRSAEECLSFEPRTSRIAPVGLAGIESASAGIAEQAGAKDEIQASEQEHAVVSAQVWFQLSGPEQQRFGQCFSLMVLKALGRR